MKTILYMVVWGNNNIENYYVSDLFDLLEILKQECNRKGLPDLIYRKT